jgi:uncharacterized repeat protein (TIGR03803 family)
MEKSKRRLAVTFSLISLLSLFDLAGHAGAQGYTYTVLHSFCGFCTDGSGPLAGLIQDAAGNLYGTTYAGGANDEGTVFEVDSSGQETVLYSFCSRGGSKCKDGALPYAGLIEDAAGNLYGTAYDGGADGWPGGTIFKVDSTGHEEVLFDFCSEGCETGQEPAAGLIQDAAGNLYGTTQYGGAGNCDFGLDYTGCGTVFKITRRKETVLYRFKDPPDGTNPVSGLVMDEKGNLYGTTPIGGVNKSGTVFRVDSDGHEKVLYNFCSQGGADCTDGYEPDGLIRDTKGNLYGTTYGGGAYDGGAVFKLDKKGNETVLYSFCSEGGSSCIDGNGPNGVIQDAAGNLYGTTSGGGANGGGTVFELDSTGQETVLYSFCSAGGANCTDGFQPWAGLMRDAAGDLYGTTYLGGADYYYAGTVFKLTPGSLPAPR